jgi:translocator protein
MDIASIVGLGGFVGACTLAASMGTIFKPGDWYDGLAKPSWRPPNWLFAPVWGILYLAIALSGWLVWRSSDIAGAALPLGIYFLQLVLNAAWTPIFFGLHRMGLAFLEILLLWLSIVATIWLFSAVHVWAGWLLIPYLCWISFAAALNFAIWQRN